VMDIYSAGEKSIDGVTSDLIVKSAIGNKCEVCKFDNIENIVKTLKTGDILLTIGAGNVWQQGEELLKLI
ncbi:MAG: UDP-N-acetylmuramate--L-alanine ligase, partial [Endomicrobiaceae bacterium]|nr:UDP-N-acetylmuramate--L-alanine ligase [Endomicrobiaceae bacterium]